MVFQRGCYVNLKSLLWKIHACFLDCLWKLKKVIIPFNISSEIPSKFWFLILFEPSFWIIPFIRSLMLLLPANKQLIRCTPILACAFEKKKNVNYQYSPNKQRFNYTGSKFVFPSVTSAIEMFATKPEIPRNSINTTLKLSRYSFTVWSRLILLFISSPYQMDIYKTVKRTGACKILNCIRNGIILL